MNGDGECSSLAAYRRAYGSADRLGPEVYSHLVLCRIHHLNRVNYRIFKHDDSTVNIVVVLLLIYYYYVQVSRLSAARNCDFNIGIR